MRQEFLGRAVLVDWTVLLGAQVAVDKLPFARFDLFGILFIPGIVIEEVKT